MDVKKVLSSIEFRHPGEPEYLQAVKEVLLSIEEEYNKHPEFERVKLIERMVEPERVITFRVPWVDDKGEVHVNTGYRSVQRRPAFPLISEPLHPEVPRIRADFQKRTHHSAHGRRQGRLGFLHPRTVRR